MSCTASGLVRVHSPAASSSTQEASATIPDVWVQRASFQTCSNVLSMVRVRPCLSEHVGFIWEASSRHGRCFHDCSCCNPVPQAVDSSGCYVAVGGDGCNLQVWSLAEQKEVFRAKGGKPNM